MIRALYSLLTWLAQPFLRRKLARRARAEPGYAVAVDERFGHYTVPADSGRLWIHAVSLGEARAAGILLEALRPAWPGLRLLLTHGTATGRALGARLLQDGDVQVWQPWDTPQAVARFLEHFKPHMGILMETEVWPNLIAGCASRGVPVALANARLNERSFRQAQRLAALARPAYGALAAVWAQTEADAQRLRALDAKVAGVFGNLKFDAAPDAEQIVMGQRWGEAVARPVILLASSREGEEAAFLNLIAELPSVQRSQDAINNGANSTGDPDRGRTRVQWLIVPRHPQRFDAVAQRVLAHGLTLSRRSAWGDQPPLQLMADETGPTVWLGDSMGEMALYYAMSDVALLGGSFEPLGGQNLIEAAACGCPVVMGPHTFNFAQAAELAEAAGAAVTVPDPGAAVQQALAWAADPVERERRAKAALAFAAAHRGAARRTVQAIVELRR